MAEIKKPFSFQRRILKQCIDALKVDDRATVVMPCGSGKTLIGLWLAETLQAETVIVFAPTLGLLAQLAREWLTNTLEQRTGCLAVCSDPSLMNGLDEICLAPEEYPFTVASDQESLRIYLDADIRGRKLIFCTYQSADLVASALRPRERIDFGVFDEAHRTAGKIGAFFAFALSDERLPIRKRVFMTATPRVYSRGPASIRSLAYSMDNIQHYGSICAAMTFAEAIASNIVCDYQVLISEITSGDLNLEEMDNSLIQNEDIDLRTAASRAGLVKVLERYNINKVITFHTTIKKAKDFAEKVMANFLPDYAKLHLSSEMPGNQRQQTMRQFAEEPKAIISNARCLTEGIDVPNVDMVAFMDPKASETDIIQAIGRALRKAENKELGSIFIPVFLDQRFGGEPMAGALRRSRYEAIWNVLVAIRSFDSRMEQQAAVWRRNLGETRERRAPDWTAVKILSSDIGQEEIRESIEVFIAEELSNVWDEHYGQLRRFRDTFGHVQVPKDNWLYGWLKTQRRFWKTRLSEQQRQLLLGLGVDPNPQMSKINRILEALVDYAQKHGHCNVKQTDNMKLYRWLVDQRKKYHNGALEVPMRAKLEALGIDWGDDAARFFNSFIQKYSAYRQEKGKPPGFYRKDRDPEAISMVRYLVKLRKAYKNGELSEERIAACQAAQIDLEPLVTQWNKRYEELLRWLEQHGSSLLFQGKAAPFENWIHYNRKLYRRGLLTAERKDKLMAVGVVPDIPAENAEDWRKRFETVRSYFQQNDTYHLPSHHAEYHWLKEQRKRLKQNQLSPNRAVLLLSLNHTPPGSLDRRKKSNPGLWSVQEKQLVRRNPDLSIEELKRLLPKRSEQSILALKRRFGW